MIPAYLLAAISVALFALAIVAVSTGSAMDIARFSIDWVSLTDDPIGYYWAALISIWLGLGTAVLAGLALALHSRARVTRVSKIRSKRDAY